MTNNILIEVYLLIGVGLFIWAFLFSGFLDPETSCRFPGTICRVPGTICKTHAIF